MYRTINTGTVPSSFVAHRRGLQLSNHEPGISRPFVPANYSSFEDDDAELTTSEEEPAVDREGLPPTFRMRADPHYVEQLATAKSSLAIVSVPVHAIDLEGSTPDVAPQLIESIRRYGILEPLQLQKRADGYRVIAGRQRVAAARVLGLRDVPCLVHHVDDDQARALGGTLSETSVGVAQLSPSWLPACDAALTQSLTAVASCAELLRPSASRLTQAVAVDLVRAEVARADYLHRVASILRQDTAYSRAHLNVDELLASVQAVVEAERRLRGVELVTRGAHASNAAIWGDRQILTVGLSGVLLSLLGEMEGAKGARLSVTTHVDTPDQLTVVIAQAVVSLRQPRHTQMDGGATAEPNPLSPAFAVSALQHVVRQHGGRVTVTALVDDARVCVDLPLDARRRR